jgi:hypothetical protein
MCISKRVGTPQSGPERFDARIIGAGRKILVLEKPLAVVVFESPG